MPTRIFLSYAHKDLDRVRLLEKPLVAGGVAVWRDQDRLRGGHRWPKAIGEAIADSNGLLLAWSVHAAGSNFVELEWATALALGKLLIPCLLDEEPLPPALTSLHAINAREPSRASASIVAALGLGATVPDPNRRAQVLEGLDEITATDASEVLSSARAVFAQRGWAVQGSVFYQAGRDVIIVQRPVEPRQGILDRITEAIGWNAGKPRPVPAEASRPSAIKGLRPFGYEDREIFSRLQREDTAAECAAAIADPAFRFGILTGESGCGKSSLLQAALRPRLERQAVPHRCVYVKLGDLDPVDDIHQALVEQLGVPGEVGADLVSLLKLGTADGGPLVLLLDQFEQFFARRPERTAREPFTNALALWYREGARVRAKFLVSIRSDFTDRLVELQKAMGYSLGPQQVFRLERFQPQEAAAVLGVIAGSEGLACDTVFAAEMTRQELASREDGLVSPVDLQVLAWMVRGQKTDEERAFTRRAFEKLGGVEGLLERFLERALRARETDRRRDAALKVLLAVTDLDRNVRAGPMTTDDIERKVEASLDRTDVNEAIGWLARADVRLITPDDRGGTARYELAHERLIPAIRKVADRQLSEADRANQLLDRRVNEWLGNGRAHRYLLTWREWRLIAAQSLYIAWGPRRAQKEELIALSRRRTKLHAAMLGCVALLFLLGGIAWNGRWWQLYLVERELGVLVERTSSSQFLDEIADAVAGARHFGLGYRAAVKIADPSARTVAIASVAAGAAVAGDKRKAAELLAEARAASGNIEGAYASARYEKERRDRALAAIVDASLQSAVLNRDSGLLAVGEEMTAKITEPASQVRGRAAVAHAAANIGDAKKASELLAKMPDDAAKLDDPLKQAQILIVMAGAAAKIGDSERLTKAQEAAMKLGGSLTPVVLAEIAVASAKTGDTKGASTLLAEASAAAANYFSVDAVDVRVYVAEAAAKVGDAALASTLLKEARQAVQAVQTHEPLRAYALGGIAEAAAKIGDVPTALALLREAREEATKVTKDSDRDLVRQYVARAAVRSVASTPDRSLLSFTREVVADMKDASRAQALADIAPAAAAVGDDAGARALLAEAHAVAKDAEDFDEQARIAIVKASSKLGRWGEARSDAMTMSNDHRRALALSCVLIIDSEQRAKRGRNAQRLSPPRRDVCAFGPGD